MSCGLLWAIPDECFSSLLNFPGVVFSVLSLLLMRLVVLGPSLPRFGD